MLLNGFTPSIYFTLLSSLSKSVFDTPILTSKLLFLTILSNSLIVKSNEDTLSRTSLGTSLIVSLIICGSFTISFTTSFTIGSLITSTFSITFSTTGTLMSLRVMSAMCLLSSSVKT